MRKLSLRLAAVFMAAVVALLSLPVGVLATNESGLFEVYQNKASEGYVDYFNIEGGKLVASYETFEEAWNEAVKLAPTITSEQENQIVVRLPRDLKAINGSFGTGDGFDGGAIKVPDGKIICLDLHTYSIDRGLTSATKNGYVISVGEKAEITIGSTRVNKDEWNDGINSKITGGCNSGNGGGILLKANAKAVVLQGVDVSGNIANSGGGVYLEGESSKLELYGSVTANNATALLNGGGGIGIGGESAVVSGGGDISGNSASYGGGVYLDAASASLSSVQVADNQATVDGGGVYFAKKSGSLSGESDIHDNKAVRNGGNIYVYKDGCSLSDKLFVTDGTALKGGGIYVQQDCNLSISGELYINDNNNGNLYLEDNDDLIVGAVSDGSEVYLSFNGAMGSLVNKPVTSAVADTKAQYFYTDAPGYYIERQNEPTKENYRYFYLYEGTKPVISTDTHKDTATNENYGTYDGDNGSYPLQKGLFEYASVLDSDNNYAATYYYSDGYFDTDPKVYNSHLATMSLNMAMSAFVKNGAYSSEEFRADRYLNQFAHVKKLMSDIGCADDEIFVNEDYVKKPELYGEDADRLSTIGVAIGNKKLTIGGEEYTLIPVAIRGAGYEIEWGSNVTMGGSGEAEGFSDAAVQTAALIEKYVDDYSLRSQLEAGKVKFWLAGYSRASATANLTAKRLIDKYGMNTDVYAYCFEVPQGAVDSEVLKAEHTDNGGYYSIHNLINKADFVTMVGPSEMGFTRYGVDHYVPGNPVLNSSVNAVTTERNGGTVTSYSDNSYDGYEISYDADSLYYKQRQLMLAQLESVNPHIQFEDYFHEATINYIGYATGLKDLITEVGNKSITSEQFLGEFFAIVQQWGLSSDAEGNYRNYYSTYKPWDIEWGADKPADLGYFDTDMSVQDAVGVLIGFIFGKSAEDSDAIIDALLSSVLNISAVSLDGISLLEVYMDYVGEWQDRTNAEKVEMGNKLIEAIFTEAYPGAGTVLDYLTEEEGKQLKKALPVILDLALTVLGKDYVYERSGDTQVMIGTFAYNLNTFMLAHYPEINLAWLRTYDSFYENETQSHIIEADAPTAPMGTYYSDGSLVLEAENGEAFYYSLDGEVWNYYMKPVTIEKADSVKVVSLIHGKASSLVTLSAIENVEPTTEQSSTEPTLDEGSSFGAVGLLGAGVLLAAAAVGGAVALKKKKKK